MQSDGFHDTCDNHRFNQVKRCILWVWNGGKNTRIVRVVFGLENTVVTTNNGLVSGYFNKVVDGSNNVVFGYLHDVSGNTQNTAVFGNKNKPSAQNQLKFKALEEGTFYARDLVSEPGNVLHPDEYAKRLNSLKKIQLKF